MTRTQAATAVATHMRADARRALRNGWKVRLDELAAQETAAWLFNNSVIDTLPHWTTVRKVYRELYPNGAARPLVRS